MASGAECYRAPQRHCSIQGDLIVIELRPTDVENEPLLLVERGWTASGEAIPSSFAHARSAQALPGPRLPPVRGRIMLSRHDQKIAMQTSSVLLVLSRGTFGVRQGRAASQRVTLPKIVLHTI